MRFLAKVCTGRRPPPNSAAWAFLLAALFGLFASASFGQGYWGTPIVLTASNPSVIETATQPRVIFANAGAGPATGTLTWSGTGDSWEWDGTQWHYRGTAGSMSGTGWLILGLVPRSATMPSTATFTPPCVPTTCSLAGATCGNVPDGCGGSLNCGGCPAGQICGGGGIPNVCGGGGGGCIPGAWSLTAVETSGDTGRYPAIKTDASGGVHIAYYDVTTHELKYAHRPPGGAWNITVIDSRPISETLEETSMAMDNAGGLHVSYRRFPAVGDQTLHYARKPAGGNWSTPEVVERGGRVIGNSIAVDSAGGVHIAYYNYHTAAPDPIKYLYRPPGGPWRTPEVVAPSGQGRTSLQVDTTGVVHLAYVVPGPEIHYRVRLPNGTWRPAETVTTTNQPGSPSLATDTSGGVHLSYYAFTGGGVLLYAYRTPGTPPTGGIWTIQTADSTVGVGQFNSLALDPADDPHIAYRDLSNHDLRYVFRTPLGVWAAPEVVDSVGQVANYGITLDMAGSVAHVAYYDWTNGDLKYGSRCP